MFIHLCIGRYRVGTFMIVKTGSVELSGGIVDASEHFEHDSTKVSLEGSKSVARLTCKILIKIFICY